MYADSRRLRASAAALERVALDLVGSPAMTSAPPDVNGCLGTQPEAVEAAGRATTVARQAHEQLSSLVSRLSYSSEALMTTADRFDQLDADLAMEAE